MRGTSLRFFKENMAESLAVEFDILKFLVHERRNGWTSWQFRRSWSWCWVCFLRRFMWESQENLIAWESGILLVALFNDCTLALKGDKYLYFLQNSIAVQVILNTQKQHYCKEFLCRIVLLARCCAFHTERHRNNLTAALKAGRMISHWSVVFKLQSSEKFKTKFGNR